MKASELILELQEIVRENGDLDVSTEGCDCIGDCSGASMFETTDRHGVKSNYILLTRS